MQDVHEAFYSSVYTKALGVQGFYDTLVDHMQDMAIYPDAWTVCKTFLKGISVEMRQVLIHDDGLSPEMNKVEEFIVHTIHYEQALKTACHFDIIARGRKG